MAVAGKIDWESELAEFPVVNAKPSAPVKQKIDWESELADFPVVNQPTSPTDFVRGAYAGAGRGLVERDNDETPIQMTAPVPVAQPTPDPVDPVAAEREAFLRQMPFGRMTTEAPPQTKEEIAANAAEKERFLRFARREQDSAWFPNLQATTVGLGAGVSSLVLRAFGAGKKADEYNRFADAFEQAASERDSKGVMPAFVKRAARGVGKTVPTMIVSGVLGGPAASIAVAAGQEANRAVTTGKDAGLEGSKLRAYILSKGTIEAVPSIIAQRLGVGGVEKLFSKVGQEAVAKGLTQGLKQAGMTAVQELPEELITEIGHSIADKVSGVNPDALTAESLSQMAVDTTVQTLLTVGLMESPRVAGAAKNGMDRSKRLEMLRSIRETRPDLIDPISKLPNYPSRTKFEKAGGPTGTSGQQRAEAVAMAREAMQGASPQPQGEPNVQAVPGTQEEARPQQGSESLRRTGEEQVATQPASQVAQEQVATTPAKPKFTPEQYAETYWDGATGNGRRAFLGEDPNRGQFEGGSEETLRPIVRKKWAQLSPEEKARVIEGIGVKSSFGQDSATSQTPAATSTTDAAATEADRLSSIGSEDDVKRGREARMRDEAAANQQSPAAVPEPVVEKPANSKTEAVASESERWSGIGSYYDYLISVGNTPEQAQAKVDQRTKQAPAQQPDSQTPESRADALRGRLGEIQAEMDSTDYEAADSPRMKELADEFFSVSESIRELEQKTGSQSIAGPSGESTPAPTKPASQDSYSTIKREHGYDVKPYEGEESPEVQDARRVAESLGLKFQAVSEPTGKMRGATVDGTVYVRGDLTGDALWSTVGHEIGHGIKAEELDIFPKEMLDKAEVDRKARASEAYRKRMEADPELARREGAAELVGQFMRNESFRNQLERTNPPLWRKIVDWVRGALTGAKSDPAQKLLGELQSRMNQSQPKDTQTELTQSQSEAVDKLTKIPKMLYKDLIEEAKSIGLTKYSGKKMAKLVQEIEEHYKKIAGPEGRRQVQDRMKAQAEEAKTPVVNAEIRPEIYKIASDVEKSFSRTPEVAAHVNGVLQDLANAGALDPIQGRNDGYFHNAIRNAAIKSYQANPTSAVPKGKAAPDFAVDELAAKERTPPSEAELAVEKAKSYRKPAMEILANENPVLADTLNAAYFVGTDGKLQERKIGEVQKILGVGKTTAYQRLAEAKKQLGVIIEELEKKGSPKSDRKLHKDPNETSKEFFFTNTIPGEIGSQPGVTFTLSNAPESVFTIENDTVIESRGGQVVSKQPREDFGNERFNTPHPDDQPTVDFDDSKLKPAETTKPSAKKPPPLPTPSAPKQGKPSPLGGRVKGVKSKPTGSEFPEAEKAKAESEAARPTYKTYGFFGGGWRKGSRNRGGVVPPGAQAPDPAIEQRLSKAHGVTPQSWAEWGKEILVAAWHKVTRHLEHLPRNAKYAVAYDFFRRLQDVPKRSQDEAVRVVAAILDPLSPEQKALFERSLVAENLLNAVDSGQPLRFGFENRQQVADYKAQLDALVAATPEVAAALATRARVVEELVNELKAEGLIGENVSPEHYYHQQVLTYLEAKQRVGRGAVPRPVKRSFQKSRATGPDEFGEHLDYNTSYIEAETSWMTDARIELEKSKLLSQLENEYDELPALRAAAKANGTTWEDELRARPDLELWQPRPGNLFYKATTIPERIAEQLQAGTIASANLTADDLRTVLAMGGPHKQWAVPKELATQLESSKKPEPPGVIGKLSLEAVASWKVWSLLNPKRFLGYRLRNMSGDADPVIAAAPGVFKPKYSGRGSVELWNYFNSDTLPMSRDLTAARDYGVIDSSMVATEIPDIKDLAVFKRFQTQSDGLLSVPEKLVRGYFDAAKKYSAFHESILRYGSFLYYKDKLANGTLEHYGTSKKEVIDALHQKLGVDAAAATLARDLMGDYGLRTVFGNWLRSRLIPFWSFQEVNIQRYPALIANAWRAGNGGAVARASAMAGKAIATGLTMRVGAGYALYWLWNNLKYPEEEKELSPYDRANPHVTMGRNPDGSIVVFRNVGAMGDFLEWFGLNDATALMGHYMDGKMSLGSVAKEMAKSPMNKVIGGVAPHIKAPFEVVTGKSMFPDVANWRTTERGEIIAGIAGLQDEYKWAKGMIVGKGNRARPYYWQRWMFGVSDPRQNALSEMLDLREKFLEKKGIAAEGSYPLSKFRNARFAAQNEDYDAFIEWKNDYLKSEENTGAAAQKFFALIKRLDPVAAGLNRKDEIEFEQKFLNDQQRIRLKVARDYAQKLGVTLAQWWIASEGPLPPTKSKGVKKSRNPY